MSAQKRDLDHGVAWRGPDALIPSHAREEICRLLTGPGTRLCRPGSACPRACVGFLLFGAIGHRAATIDDRRGDRTAVADVGKPP